MRTDGQLPRVAPIPLFVHTYVRKRESVETDFSLDRLSRNFVNALHLLRISTHMPIQQSESVNLVYEYKYQT